MGKFKNLDLIQCDGLRLKALIRSGIKMLELRKDELDSIDVFPVPDGDAGKNMHYTLLAAWQSVRKTGSSSAGKVAHAAATGAFQGARGCSGMIFLSLLTGFANVVKEKDVITPQDFAKGLSVAADEAYKKLAEPKEGTILTVARKLAAAAEKICENKATLLDVLKAVHEESKLALSQTPEELPALKEAGVVDAGASGLVYFFEGMLRYSLAQPINKTASGSPLKAPNVKESSREEYCVEFILVGSNIDENKLMKTLTEIGHAVILNKGEGEQFKIHIHAPDPKNVFDRTSRFGRPTHIKVDDLSHEQKAYSKKLNKK